MAHDPISGKPVEEKAKPKPLVGQGRVCFRCNERVWHKDYYDHMDVHLDEYNTEIYERIYLAAVGADINFDQERFNEVNE